jgi:hypothetical protein
VWTRGRHNTLTEELMRPIGRFGPVAAKGVADASLYDRFDQAFERATPCPFWAAMIPPPPFQVTVTAGMLEPNQTKVLRSAVDAAEPNTFQAAPYHAVVGYKVSS